MFAELSPILAAGNTGELFRQVLPIALVGVLLVIILQLGLVALGRRQSARSKWNLWDMLIYLGLLGAVGVLAVTSFVTVLVHGELGGWPLFFHMFGAGAFTAVLPLLALSWANGNRLALPAAGDAPPKFPWISKLMFWVIVASGLVVTMTMLISMLPIYGSNGLIVLLDVHRYSGLVVVAAAAVHLVAVVTQRIGRR